MSNRKSRARKMAVIGTGGFFLMFFLAFILGFFVMLLWNWLMPVIFGLPEITYWQAWGLFILTKLLFGTGKRHRTYRDSENRSERRKRMKQKFRKWLDAEEDEMADDVPSKSTE